MQEDTSCFIFYMGSRGKTTEVGGDSSGEGRKRGEGVSEGNGSKYNQSTHVHKEVIMKFVFFCTINILMTKGCYKNSDVQCDNESWW